MSNLQRTKRKSKPSKKSGKSKVVLMIGIILVVMLAGIGLGFLSANFNTKPGLTNDIRPAASSQIFDVNGNLICNLHLEENRLPIKLDKMPKDLQHAFVAVEDARFYKHCGIDPIGIMRAMFRNITSGNVSEGGSTITQQLAKNAYLSQERTLKRKIQEVFLALQIERQYTKDEILEMYLNQIYFGQGAYGIQAAAKTYFNKNAEDLTLPECAMLAGIPKSPNYYSPFNNLKASKARQEVVLSQMAKYQYIDSATADRAKATEIVLADQSSGTKPRQLASYFVDYVTQILIEKYGADAVYKEGLKIYTTLDIDMQKAAEAAINQLPTYRTDDNNVQQPQVAIVAIDPHTGHIRAMVGGRGNDHFNRATMAERQPGSAWKPFVYLAAIDSGMSPNTTIRDAKVTIDGWSPKNYSGNYSGTVTLRYALEHSLNIPAVKLAQQVGTEKVLRYASNLGISSLVFDGSVNDNNLSAAALGGLTRGVTPLEMASAYGALATGGVLAKATPIIKVVNRDGKVLEENLTSHSKEVVNPASAYIVTDMLKGVIQNGTGGNANIGRPVAGKTGTTDNNRDAWFVGYTPDLVASVWVGMDNDGNLASNVTGGTLPASIWYDFMRVAVSNMPANDFTRPRGVDMNRESLKATDSGDPLPEEDKDKDKKDDKDKDAKDKDKATDSDKQQSGKSQKADKKSSKPSSNAPSTPSNQASESTSPALPPPPSRKN